MHFLEVSAFLITITGITAQVILLPENYNFQGAVQHAPPAVAPGVPPRSAQSPHFYKPLIYLSAPSLYLPDPSLERKSEAAEQGPGFNIPFHKYGPLAPYFLPVVDTFGGHHLDSGQAEFIRSPAYDEEEGTDKKDEEQHIDEEKPSDGDQPLTPEEALRRGSKGDTKNYNKGTVEKIVFPSHASSSTCGVLATTKSNQLKSQLDAALLESERREDTLDGAALSGSTQDFLTSLDWQGPDLTKTIFYEVMGAVSLLNKKITFGQVADKTEAPWQVAMFVNGKFHCGASIIGDYFLLTAAHCVSSYRYRPNALKVVLGDWDLRSRTDLPSVTVEIEKILPHPEFNFFLLKSDIAVMKTKKKIPFSDNIRSVCLPPPGLDVEGELIKVTGWGRNEKNTLQTKLQKLHAIVIQNGECARLWSRKGAPRTMIEDTVLCMDTQDGDSCKGDSGGPCGMEYPANSGRFVQVGIVSFGSGSCTDANLPGVYTKVAKFVGWVNKMMAL